MKGFLKWSASSFEIKRDMACVSEAIRTEGNIACNFQGITITNKNLFLLNKVENSIRHLFSNTINFSRILHIYVWLQPKEEVKEIENEAGKIIKHFNFRKFKQNDRILTFVDSVNSLCFNKKYKIKLDNRTLLIDIKSENYDIKIDSNTNAKTTSYIQYTIYNSKFSRFLHDEFKIQLGKKSYDIFMPKMIKNAGNDIKKEIIGIVVSCEGNIGNFNKATRLISVKMCSRKYLSDLSDMLNEFGISNRIYKAENRLWTLKISRKKNLEQFYKTIKLFHSEKIREMKKLIKAYSKNRFAHWEADKAYLRAVKDFGSTTSENLAKHLSKDSNHIRFRLKKLMENGYLTRIGGKCYGYYRKRDPYVYSITETGKKFINS